MPTTRPRLEFWYEFASTYSYLSAMRIEALTEKAGVDVVWKPFVLGPIFNAQGWNTSPFNIYPAKGKYMVREMERLTKQRGLPFRMPSPFPQNGLYAARLALIGHDEGWGPAFTRAAYTAQFAESANIFNRETLADILKSLRLNASSLLARIEEPHIKQRLRQQTEEAQELGIFGAPSFLAGNELYWGDDRLEQAVIQLTSG
jgi:2-hydroxychromene-2-carboxylate isomerase